MGLLSQRTLRRQLDNNTDVLAHVHAMVSASLIPRQIAACACDCVCSSIVRASQHKPREKNACSELSGVRSTMFYSSNSIYIYPKIASGMI